MDSVLIFRKMNEILYYFVIKKKEY